MSPRVKLCLYVLSALADFTPVIVVFTVSRNLAEAGTEPLMMGLVGGVYAIGQGIGSILGGWLAHRFHSAGVFLTGAGLLCAATIGCASFETATTGQMLSYWLMSVGVGFFFPPLIGWLNQGEDAHQNRRGVSRTLILYCVAWNLGMIQGQLLGGSLFAIDPQWCLRAGVAAALVNGGLSLLCVRWIRHTTLPVPVVTPTAHALLELAAAFKQLSWLANLAGMFGASMVVHLLPDLAVSIGIPPQDHGLLLAGWRVVVIGTYLVMHQFVFWHYRFRVAFLSQLVAAAGLALIALAQSPLSLMLGLAMLGQLVGYNYFAGLYYSTAGSAHEGRVWSASMHEATLAVGMAVGTIAGGALGTWIGHRAPYGLASLVTILLLTVQTIAYFRWIPPLRRAAPSPSTSY